MRLTRRIPEPVALPAWRIDAAQLLEEHHLVAWSPLATRRTTFATELAQHLARFEDTQVCVINGAGISDLASFAATLEEQLHVGHIQPRLAGSSGLLDCLRRRPKDLERPTLKRRFYIWLDADALLRRDHRLFGRIVDAFAGIAAESEYASEDVLLLHRAIFVGSSVLDVYAEDPRGQVRTWWSEHGETPFWNVVTGVERPVFLRYRIEDAVAAA